MLRHNTGAFAGVEESSSRFRAKAHLSDDETVAKMGHPDLLWVRPGLGQPLWTVRRTHLLHRGSTD
jgi:hypothetical protein